MTTVYPWGAAVILQPDERVIAWVEDCWDLSKVDSGALGRGYSIVTDQRLLFARRGLYATEVSNAIRLEDIVSVSGSPTYLRTGEASRMLVIDRNDERREFVTEASNPKATMQSFASTVSEAMVKRKGAIQAQQLGQSTSAVTDFSWLREHLDKGGIVLTAAKCPQCGAGLELPKSGTATKCQFCGANVYAQDIFEKLKGLLKS